MVENGEPLGLMDMSTEDTPLAGIEIERIVTDGDLDGVMTAAILRRLWPDVEIVFSNPGAIRSGLMDHLIDSKTAICDLPAHPAAGLIIDHHETNRISKDDGNDGFGKQIRIWRATKSAARIAFDEVGKIRGVDDLAEILEWVDMLDGGDISKEDFLAGEAMVRLGRLIDADSKPDIASTILEAFQLGKRVDEILSIPMVAQADLSAQIERKEIHRIIDENTEIIDRLAIVRFDGTGVRTNGYEVTARIGDDCDACLLLHGSVNGSLEFGSAAPLGASFYNNSFLHPKGGKADLTRLAMAIDSDGGGHRNACGCRVKAISDNGDLEEREVCDDDIQRNLQRWLEIWAEMRR
jgi:hypothetical protein